ncbi:Histidine kinase [Azospirillaceae bacterium]
MVRMFFATLLTLLTLLSGQPARAVEVGSESEAKALVDRAIAYYKEVGREVAFAEISNNKGKFVDRDLYVLVSDMNGVFLAHGANKGLINKSLLELKDVNGKLIVRSMVDAAKAVPSGSWVDYVWTNPTTKKLESKKTWIKAEGDIFFGVGVYDKK